MQCISPLNIQRPNGQGPKDRILVPCSVCPACLANRRLEWTIRIKEELKCADSAHFITLTYEDENLPYGLSENSLDKTDLQKFFKRLRKTGEIVRYYAVGEYGTRTYRPHYHIILFNCKNVDNIVKSWKLGFCKIDKVEGASIHYVTKYHVNKTHYPNGSEKPFALISKKPAIGANYINRMQDYHEGYPDRAFYTELGGRKQKLPRYYRQKLYSESDNILISQKNVSKSTIAENKRIMDYENSSNTQSYFEYDSALKKELIRTYKQKSNYNNKI